MDKIKPLKIETSIDGTEIDPFPTEADPTEDYAAVKGIAFENNSSRLFDLSGSGEIQWKDAIQTTYKTLNSLVAGVAAIRYVAICGYNSTANTGRWLEFQDGVPSNVAGHVIAENSILKALSVSVESNATASIEIFKNGTGITTISLSAQRKNYVTGLSNSLATLDEISAQIVSGTCGKPVLNVFIQVV